MNDPQEMQTFFLAKYAYPFQLFRLGRDVFMTKKEAKKRVEQMRKRKLESLEKQMKALQEMQISIETKTN